MSQLHPQGGQSSSFSMQEESDIGVQQIITNLNKNHQTQVRRPNESNVLAFMDYEMSRFYTFFNHIQKKGNLTFQNRPSNSELASKGLATIHSQKAEVEVEVDNIIIEQDSPPKTPFSHNKRVSESVQLIDSPQLENDQFIHQNHNSSISKRNSNDEQHSRLKSRQLLYSKYQQSQIEGSPRKKSSIKKIFSKLTNRMHLVKQFADLLKSISPFRSQSKLTMKQANLLQDLASEQNGQKLNINALDNTTVMLLAKNQTSLFKSKFKQSNSLNATQKLKRIQNCIGILRNNTISPQSNFIFMWELIKFFLTLSLLIELTIQVCFYQNYAQFLLIKSIPVNIVLYVLIWLFYCVDICLGFKTGFYQDGEAITKQKKVASHYYKQFFWKEIISLSPPIINILYILSRRTNDEESIWIKIVNLTLFIKVATLRQIKQQFFYFLLKSRVFHNLEGRLQFSPVFQYFYRFCSVLGMVFLYAHVIGCFWYLVGQNSSNTHNWIIEKDFQNEDWSKLYIYSIYWSVMTMSTVGYGDITAQNSYEAAFTIFTMLLSSIVFAYSLNTIGNILNEISRDKREISKNMSIINRYMQRKNLEPALQFKVRQYLQHLWNEESEFKIDDENKILNRLSQSLQEEIQVSLYGKFVANIPILYRYFSNHFLLQLTKVIQEYRIPPNTYVVEGGSPEGRGLYFLVWGEAECQLDLNQKRQILGKVKVTLYKNQKIIVQKNEVFGHSSFFYNREQPYSVKTTQVSSFAYLSHSSFLEVLKKHPSDYQTYRMLMDRVDFQGLKLDLGIKCLGCGENNHDIDVCRFLHFQLNHMVVVQKHVYSESNDRLEYNRLGRRTTNAKFGQKLFEDAASLYQENNLSILSEGSFSQLQQTEVVNQFMDDYRRGGGKSGGESMKSLSQKSSHGQGRVRKKSHSMNSIVIQQSDEESNFNLQKSYSGYKSHDSRGGEFQPSLDKLSAIPLINTNAVAQGGSLLSQSSFQLFSKDNSRKISKQMDSEKMSNNSVNQVQVQVMHKSSSQSKSNREGSASSSGNQQGQQQNFVSQGQSTTLGAVQIGLSVIPAPVVFQTVMMEDKSFSKQQFEDSVVVQHQRQKKQQIGKTMNQNKFSPIPQPLQPIPSVSEMNESIGQEQKISKQASLVSVHSRTNRRNPSLVSEGDTQFQMMKRSNNHLYQDNNKQPSIRHQQRGSSKFTGETFKQFMQNPPELHNYSYELENVFESPVKLNSYFPSQNMERVVENYKRFQIKNLTYIKYFQLIFFFQKRQQKRDSESL